MQSIKLSEVHVLTMSFKTIVLTKLLFAQNLIINCHNQTKSQKQLKISAHADGGPRSKVCARKTLRSAPGTCVCRVTFKNFKKKLKKLKIAPRRPGGGGGVNFFFYPHFYYFFLGAHAKI